MAHLSPWTALRSLAGPSTKTWKWTFNSKSSTTLRLFGFILTFFVIVRRSEKDGKGKIVIKYRRHGIGVRGV